MGCNLFLRFSHVVLLIVSKCLFFEQSYFWLVSIATLKIPFKTVLLSQKFYKQESQPSEKSTHEGALEDGPLHAETKGKSEQQDRKSVV